MIQLKCPKCGMISNVSEDTFQRALNKPTADGAECLSCRERLPYDFKRHLESLLKKEGFDGWEVGTLFKQ